MDVLTVINTFDGSEEAVKPTPGGRQRRLNEDNHERQQTKKIHYSGGGRIPTIGCKHTSAKCFCQADRLTPDDLVMNFQKFHDKPNKVEQDAALLYLMSVSEVKRQRQNDENRQKGRNVTVKYSLLWDEHPNKLPVCKATFLSVLGISKDRASRVAQYYAETAEARPERRGGARNIEGSDSRRQLIINHIKTFTCRASHYGQAYYSRQLYLYLFGVVRHHGENSRQPKEDVHLYVWQENQGPKDSNMIASALNDCFIVRLASQIRRSKGLRLFSDSC
ncbi:hypothetical protein AALO_G00284190 [Alosa alosa]|uniref:Uncharacterized protein n=1 Tax=Alosa alosa TaxID=278164 RepID=A0AAV6FL09_9TELE|nr:uncharacterized protein LOC125287229 [Alosa alosa]KAG5263245.1 hypothetical protein AALO_G00284190 [Alosa alosa]